jgi:transglutaminase-like putative cysteine protease
MTAGRAIGPPFSFYLIALSWRRAPAWRVRSLCLSLRLLLTSTLAVSAVALSAAAADQPIYSPPAPWVDVAAIPPPPPEEGAPAIQFLVEDHQSRLDPAGDAFYNRSVVKILKPEGLTEVKSLGVIWSPDTETITFHTLNIIRGDKVIDLLADHKAMLVLRRETNLEQASLDGRITASRQIDGLQTGDVVDFAYTRTHADPVLKGHSFANDALAFPGVAGRYRATISWPKAEKVQWKALPGFDDPQITATKDGRTLLAMDKTDAEAPKAPIGAPLRFRRVGQIQATSFQNWNEVSKLMAPLYAKASDIAATSPLKAEADAIAAKTTDPKARAFAALQLVENKTRYFFIGMGEGGYVPADADDTWARRFGDCKAKTALLLALLKTLNVDAEPVLVNLGAGDGIDELPPSLAAFNHVLVRVKVADKSYWLDGTRTGDTNPESMHAPPYRWGLPVRASGATLEKIVEPQITVPQTYTVVRLDASKGLEALAPAKISITYSGILATQARALVARTPKADFERGLRQQYSNPAGGMEIDQVSWRDDAVRDLFTIEMSGTDDMDWHKNQDLGVREFRVGTGAAPRPFPKREPSANRDAPFAIPYPSYTRSRTEIVLPDGGKGFTIRGQNGTVKVAGYEIASGAAIQGDVASFTVDRHSVVQEITAAEAEAANHQIRELRDVETFVRTPVQASAPTPAQF